MNKSGKQGTWTRKMLIILCVVLLLILAVIGAATGYVNYLLSHMNYVDKDGEYTLSASEAEDLFFDGDDLQTIDPDSTDSIIHIDDIIQPGPMGDDTQNGGSQNTQTEPLTVITGDHLVNILLVGQDRRPGESRQRSDTMILVTFNKSQNTITLTSFMRDQYVAIPGYKPNKLNAAYQFGGMKLLTNTLLENFGVSVDGVVEVDFGGFENIINLVGGVDIKLTEAEVEYFNSVYNWGLEAGVNHLDGSKALAYARLRSIDTDYNRAARQRNVITALLNSCKKLSLSEMLALVDDVLSIITTNIENGRIISYVTELFPMLTTASMNNARIPVDGTYQYGIVQVREGLTAWFQYNIDFYANNEYLNEIFKKAG